MSKYFLFKKTKTSKNLRKIHNSIIMTIISAFNNKQKKKHKTTFIHLKKNVNSIFIFAAIDHNLSVVTIFLNLLYVFTTKKKIHHYYSADENYHKKLNNQLRRRE
jgi:hypothetical protein